MMTLIEYQNALAARAKALLASNSPAIVIERWHGAFESPEWAAWVRYWAAIGATATLEIVKDRQTWTVPTMTPTEFDAGYWQ